MNLLSEGERSRLRAAASQLQKDGLRKFTSWWLITGAPGSGKTTLAHRFAAGGWHVVEDPGRAEVEHQMEAGIGAVESRRDYLDFQRRVLDRALREIEQLPTNGKNIVLDYGVAEALAFMKAARIPWEDVFIHAAAKYHFEKVFILDIVALETEDPIRREGAELRAQLRGLICEIYAALGHGYVAVPSVPVTERLRLVMEHADAGRA